jgi:hypothetical protein
LLWSRFVLFRAFFQAIWPTNTTLTGTAHLIAHVCIRVWSRGRGHLCLHRRRWWNIMEGDLDSSASSLAPVCVFRRLGGDWGIAGANGEVESRRGRG